MADQIFSNGWNNERQSIIDDTLSTLRDQQDDMQQQDFVGDYKFNPQMFNVSGRVNYVAGPVLFEAPFRSAPNITFGQRPSFVDQASINTVSSIAPFIVEPYVFQWHSVGGEVAGFYLGLYAKTTAPDRVMEHTVSWRAFGPASRYKNQTTTEAWTESYDLNSPSFLEEQPTEGEYE